MHRRFDRPGLEISRRCFSSFPARTDVTVEHESSALIRAQTLVPQVHFDMFGRKSNRDFLKKATRDERLHSVIVPRSSRAGALQFIEWHQRSSVCQLSKTRRIECVAVQEDFLRLLVQLYFPAKRRRN